MKRRESPTAVMSPDLIMYKCELRESNTAAEEKWSEEAESMNRFDFGLQMREDEKSQVTRKRNLKLKRNAREGRNQILKSNQVP